MRFVVFHRESASGERYKVFVNPEKVTSVTTIGMNYPNPTRIDFVGDYQLGLSVCEDIETVVERLRGIE